jgi:pyrroloquinoline quinone biosynthesis protein D
MRCTISASIPRINSGASAVQSVADEVSVKFDPTIQRPILAGHVRYRWDAIREQHQIVFPEGVLILNESAAAIVRCCDGRSIEDLIAASTSQYPDGDPATDVPAFLGRLTEKGFLRNAAER